MCEGDINLENIVEYVEGAVYIKESKKDDIIVCLI